MSYPFAALLIASLASSIIISTSLFLVPLGFPWFAWIALGLAVLIVAGRETLTVADGAGGNIDFAKTLLIKLIMCVYFVFGLAAVTGFISLKWPIYFMLFSWLVVYVVIWTLNRNTE